MDQHGNGYRILLADGDVSVYKELMPAFRDAGLHLIPAYDGSDALNLFRRQRPDLVILEMILPSIDGLALCRQIRQESFVPMLVLSEKTEEFDRLLALEVGADDYLCKPFSLKEVLAKARALLRRTHEYSASANPTHLVTGNLDLDRASFLASVSGEEITLTAKEMEILWILASNPGIVFSREHLLQRVWGYDFTGDLRAVDSHIKRLRIKLKGKENGWEIRTVWGIGYRFEIR